MMMTQKKLETLSQYSTCGALLGGDVPTGSQTKSHHDDVRPDVLKSVPDAPL